MWLLALRCVSGVCEVWFYLFSCVILLTIVWVRYCYVCVLRIVWLYDVLAVYLVYFCLFVIVVWFMIVLSMYWCGLSIHICSLLGLFNFNVLFTVRLIVLVVCCSWFSLFAYTYWLWWVSVVAVCGLLTYLFYWRWLFSDLLWFTVCVEYLCFANSYMFVWFLVCMVVPACIDVWRLLL